MPIAQLSIDMVAKVAEFEKDLKRTVSLTEQQTNQMSKAFDAVGTAIKGIGIGLMVEAFTSSVRSVASYADEMGKMSQKVGVSVESLSALSYAAKLADTSNEVLGKGLKKLSMLMAEAAGGSEDAKKTLKALGTSETQDTQKALYDIADRFSNLKDGMGKTALAGKGFGEKIGAELIPMLNGGSESLKAAAEEARKFGIIVSTEAAVAAEKFNDNLERLAEMSKGAKVSLFSDLIEGLGNATAAYIQAAKEGSKYMGVLAAIQVLLTGDDRHKNNVQLVEDTDALLASENALVSFRKQGYAEDSRVIENVKLKIASLKENIKLNQNYRKVLDDEAAQAAPKSKTGTVDSAIFNPEKLKATRDLSEQGRKLAESLISQSAELSPDFLEKWNKLADAYKGAAISLDTLTLAQAELLKQQPFEKRALDEALKVATERQAARAKESADIEAFQTATINAEDKYWRDLLAATPTGKLEEQRATVQKITDAFSAGKFGAPDSAAAAATYGEVINTYLNNVPAAVEKSKSAADELGMSFASAFEDAIVAGKDLGSVIDGLVQDMLRLTIRKAFTEPMANYFSSAIASMLPGFAVGTDYVPQDMVARIHKGERIIPAAQNATSGGSGQSINISINATVGDVASKADVVAGMRATANQIAAQISRSQHYGGAMA